ncbi:dipeptide/oligopeptide/nickel ABC transporter permease/ATP-binding protein [Streptomyces phaeochromogenes]|uniref:dipeptide/oligopeptide/nickel ABC transporter permease/ATP-binding protein n=1 Tax=Streptomyces phaeochromogenes TaxID=1923 RepID=UPI002DDAF388|nr:dipeptide/oligopeptide/nickel ABC transporter permease/ATP-binding protein [Streptomyces phaeochromogenes]WRZ34576.1 dipeptide/oligopeptide/nickel ABC transporter permease/ATP-binding protein [Streptomyces phaeochromogenes]
MTAVTPGTTTSSQPKVEQSHFLRQLLRQPLAIACLAIVVLIVLACVFASWIAPYGPQTQDLNDLLSGPSRSHWLGTDALGRDELSRLLYGGRVTLLGALEAVTVFLVLGLGLGITAGTLGGLADALIMRLCDLLQSIPALIMLLVILSIFGHNETAAMVTFGALFSTALTRVVRGASLAVRAEPYVAAARVAGLSTRQIQWRHIRPAVTGPILTQVSLVAGIALLVEASLGFLGLGVVPPTPSWGNMIADAQQAINRHPWLLVPTGGILVVMSLATALLGSMLGDAYSGRSTGTKLSLSWRTLATKVTATGVPAAKAPEPGALLSVVGMSVRLRGDRGETTVVDDVSFEVAAGEAVGIVGESGCGKSMTVTGLLRVLPPGAWLTADSCRFDGTDLLGLSESEMTRIRGKGIAYISQEPVSSLDPVFTAGAQIAEAVRVHRKVGRKAARAIALELLTTVRLPNPAEVAGKYPHELSGGMAQRVAIARALAGRPKLLIADEPTTALDVTVQAEILDLLRDLREQTGMALILVTHDWGVLADACDRAIVMYAGQTVEEADLSSLFHSATHPYSEALLRSTPANLEPGTSLPVISGSVPPPGSWPGGCRFAPRCEFAQPDCTDAPIHMRSPLPGTFSRCLHTDLLLAKEDQDASAVA